jgi:glycosyltransferase involved in cell wall biosynthesis
MPPARTGVASNNVEVVAALRGVHEIEVFADEPSARAARQAGDSRMAVRSAHDFLWAQRLRPYDLVVYQLGNSSAHDFLWPYLFRFPGLAVLHDTHLHHARAAALLRADRAHAYRTEFAANHPKASANVAELAVKGFDSHIYYHWPMTRLVVQASRLTAVHAALMVETLHEASPTAAIDTIRLGHGERLTLERTALARERVRARYAIPDDSVLFGVFGGLTPEKRVPQILEAFAALLPYEPGARLLLAGAPADHYDVAADVQRLGIGERVSITGYLHEDAAFTEAVAACDVSLNLRWPTAREVSGPWLRALAAGTPTITLDLAHTADVPALDPRSWTVTHAAPSLAAEPHPVTVAIDILDEDHSLRLAMRRLASDGALRTRLGRAAAAWWEQSHSIDSMIDDYQRVITRAIASPAPAPDLPPHLRADGSERLRGLLEPFGGDLDLWGTI